MQQMAEAIPGSSRYNVVNELVENYSDREYEVVLAEDTVRHKRLIIKVTFEPDFRNGRRHVQCVYSMVEVHDLRNQTETLVYKSRHLDGAVQHYNRM